jgi:hypothetical protein
MSYRKMWDEMSQAVADHTVIRNSDDCHITVDEDNRLYQEVLAWLAQGNELEEPRKP